MEHTIAAIATPLAPAGIGIVRVSGPEAFEILWKIYRSKGGKKDIRKAGSHTIHHGYIIQDGDCIDEVLVMIMRAPRSYTGEDTVEIDCHGGVIAMKRILEAVLHAGAVLAQPGEFTKRAFLNGRIDLSQAEAVMDLIQAKSNAALSNSMEQLMGSFADEIRRIRKTILHETAFVESALDDPEHYSLEGYGEKLEQTIKEQQEKIRKLLLSYDNGRYLQEGIRTVILGKPNAGKSSLLNLLLGQDRAIVTHVPGTTRDTLEEFASIGGISLHLVDTAGIRETDDVVEKIGIEKARNMAQKADLILYVADSSSSLDQDDQEILNLIRGKRTIILFNKSDLRSRMSLQELESFAGQKAIPFSAKEGDGLEELEKGVKELFFQGKLSYNEDFIVTSARHKSCLEEAGAALEHVSEAIHAGMPEDLYLVDLMEAYTCLGRILGEEVGEDLVNEIFNSFCMGK